ncbi:MAG: family NAD(P)-dependent oxidoreductase [Proteobacteria bacterium]|nr:family NAD(P)-dependent oxidoreductase [Pseudomonadota bacterium]
MYEAGDALKGRVILITGAAGSLGTVAAMACAAQGAQTILLDKAVKGLERLYDEIVASGYPRPALYPLDLAGATESDYQELAQTLESEFGALHGLLHSAADLGVLGPLADVDGASLERALRINVTAPHLLTRALLPLLATTGDASVVFTSDASATHRQAYWGAYGIAKTALEGLALVLAQELAAAGRIRVNILEPGPVNSALRMKSHPGEHAGQCTVVKALPCNETSMPSRFPTVHRSPCRKAISSPSSNPSAETSPSPRIAAIWCASPATMPMRWVRSPPA